MLFWIVPLIVFIGILLYMWIAEGEPGWGVGFGAIFALLAVLLVLLSAAITTCVAPVDVIDTHTHEIHALADNMQYEGYVSGNVFLIRGHSSEELRYNYMYMEEGKGFGFKSAPATDSYLNYLKDPNDTPSVKIVHYDWKSPVLRWCFGDGWVKNTEYIFHLPEGANIIDDFTIDFE